MATKDMMTTLSLIRDFWPDFTINKDNLVSPTSDFLKRFFTYFLNEYNEAITGLANEETIDEAHDPKTTLAQEFGPEVVLYRKMAKTLRQMNYTNFTLMDIYSPQSKRVHTLVKYCIHFLIYVNNHTEEITNNCNRLFEKQMQLEELNALKQHSLQEIAQNAEKLTLVHTVRERLKKKQEERKSRVEEIPLEKTRRKKIFVEKTLLKTSLENEVDNLDYKLRGLEEKEKVLQEQVVTKEDFDSLRNSEKYLEMEMEQVGREMCAVNEEFSAQAEALRYAENNLGSLEELDFDTLSTELKVLCDLEKKQKLLLLDNKELRKELKTMDTQKSKILQAIDKKNKVEKELREQLTCLEAQFASMVESSNRLFEKKVARFDALFQEAKRLETEIETTKREIAEINGDQIILKKEAIGLYKILLDASKATTCKMDRKLLGLKEGRSL